MLKYVVFAVLSVLLTTQSSFADYDAKRREHEKAFKVAGLAFGKKLEKKLNISFGGEYPKVSFLWEKEERLSFPPFWGASYTAEDKTIRIGPRLEHCPVEILLREKPVDTDSCAGLPGLLAHEYAHHYLEQLLREKTSWLGNKLKRPFARRLVDEGIAEYFKSRMLAPNMQSDQIEDDWIGKWGTAVPHHLNGLYGSRHVWIGGRIIVEPVLTTNFHRGLKCLLEYPLNIKTFYDKGVEHMEVRSMFDYRKRMIACAKGKK
jgi:hypothetical protein